MFHDLFFRCSTVEKAGIGTFHLCALKLTGKVRHVSFVPEELPFVYPTTPKEFPELVKLNSSAEIVRRITDGQA